MDELLGCYVTECRGGRGSSGSGSIYNSILQLMEWSHQKTMMPSPAPELASHDMREPADFEMQRQLIVLALAELALSRPGFEESIKEVLRFYDGEGLPTFESFKKSNSDRVKPKNHTHGILP